MTQNTSDKRVVSDFAIDLLNAGGIQRKEFRLDIDGEDISDHEGGNDLVGDLRLLMVGAVCTFATVGAA